MLDCFSESVRTAGPLIIFGSFVFVCINQIFTSNNELKKIARENDWEKGRIEWEKKFQKNTKNLLSFLVILGVCFGLTYAWINQIWGLRTSLAFMSMVGLILLAYVIRVPIRYVSQIITEEKIKKIIKKQKFD